MLALLHTEGLSVLNALLEHVECFGQKRATYPDLLVASHLKEAAQPSFLYQKAHTHMVQHTRSHK
jgi:hypothetical protein